MKKKFLFPLFLLVFIQVHGVYAQQNTRKFMQDNSQTFNCDSCNAHVILSDDFEQYPNGSFPTGNWSQTGNTDIIVDNTISAGGAQSLVMNGTIGGCWEAISCLPIPAPVSTVNGFLADFFFNVGSNHAVGCHPVTFYFNLTSTNNWSTWTGVSLLSTDYNGNIIDRAGNSISTYTYDTWYNVKIRYDRVSVDSVNLHYWLNGVCANTETVAASANENTFVYLTFGSGDGSTWIDSLRILQCDTAALPSSLFTAQHILCPGSCTNFNNLSANASSYVWNFPGGNPSTSTDANPQSVCYNTPGQYPVTLIATNSFGSDTLTLNNYITVYPYPAPQGIAQNGDTLFANQGSVSYQWYHNGVLIPGATNYFYVQWEGGDFNIVATDANGCEVEAVIYDVLASVQPAAYIQEAISIFPNPVHEKLEIRFPAAFAANAETAIDISIYNIVGEKIYAAAGYQLSSPTLTISAKDFSAGVYVVKIQTGDFVETKKIVVEK